MKLTESFTREDMNVKHYDWGQTKILKYNYQYITKDELIMITK